MLEVIVHQRLPHTRLPIAPQVIRNGSAYYVRDGHHRISVAKQFGQHYIDAVVVSGN